ncbi:MAG TPA: rhomboid family intramembrane serine protease, partial [Polyangia bacterium]|nr:rhomboid family intramembrane serine protease [Polyangia bacterium]
LPWGANFGPRTLGGQPWRLLTSAFLHFGLIHVGLNMLVLARAGQLVERLYGSVRFGAVYLFAAITGSVASVAVHPFLVSAGASGAVFGVYGALGAYLWRRRGAVPPQVVGKMVNSTLGFLALNLVVGFQSSLVDNAAHVGGLLGGALAGALLAPPFVAGVAPRGGGRPASLALGVAAALAAVAAVVLPRPFDYLAEITAFGEVEQQALNDFNSFVNQAHDRMLSDERFAQEIETKIVPSWHAARERLATRGPWPEERRPLFTAYLEYATDRERSWIDIAQALRTSDAANVQAAQAEDRAVLEDFKKKAEQLRKR